MINAPAKNIEPEKSAGLSSGRILVLLMLFAALLRAAAALTRPMIQLDETAYVRMAENLVNGHGLMEISGTTVTHFSPLFPLFIAGVATILQDYVLAAYVVVVVFGSLVLFPTYLLGRELAGERVGLMAAALVAVIPLLVDYSSRLYSESVYTFFLILGILFGRHMLRGCRVPCSILAGMALGLAYLANPSAIFYPVVLIALAVVIAVVNGVWRQMLKAAVIFLLTFSLYAVPYVVYLHSETGSWTFNGKSPGVADSASRGLDFGTVEWERVMLAIDEESGETVVQSIDDSVNPVAYIIAHPVEGSKNFLRQEESLYFRELPHILPLWLLPLIGLGLFAEGWTRRRAAKVGYLVLMMTPVLIILIMYAHDRFFIPFVPLVTIWVARGWSRLEVWGDETVSLSWPEDGRERARRWVPWAVGAAVLLPVLLFAVETVIRPVYPVEQREAGEYLAPLTGLEDKVMARQYTSAFYAGATAVLLPYADYEKTTEYARRKGVDYLVLGRDEIYVWRPTLEPLLEDEARHQQWELVQVLYPGSDRETLIFRLRDE